MDFRKPLLGLALLSIIGTAHAYDQPIVLSNWKSCAVAPLSETEGDDVLVRAMNGAAAPAMSI
ncbi:hypothetical protein ACU8OJ_21970 [Rhizobium leguminosarum]